MAKRHSTPAASPRNMIRAVGYARRSTDMQERSIPDQQAYVEKWAKEHGYEIVRWFIDDAISGTSTKGRNAFEQLITTAENGRDYETVLCYDISRFSRGGTNETGFYLHRLKQAGVDVVFTADGIPEGDEGELIQGVKSWQARQYSVKLARDVIRGQISNITVRHSAPGGVPPYGYDKQHVSASGQILRTFRWLADGTKQEFDAEGKLIRVLSKNESVKKAKSDIVRFVLSVPSRVEIVRRIYQWCLEGYGYRWIACALNAEGHVSSRGQPWHSGQIQNTLQNPCYRGALVWNRRSMGSLHGVRGNGQLIKKDAKYRRNDKQDWFVVEDVHDAIVSADDFAKARKAIDGRKWLGGRGRSANKPLLTGLIVCTNCGCNFSHRAKNDNRWKNPWSKPYYTDGGYNKYGRSVCIPVSIPEDLLNMWVLQQLRRVILNDRDVTPKAIDAFVKQVIGGQPPKEKRTDIERDVQTLDRQIKATIAMLSDPSLGDLKELKTSLIDLKKAREVLQSRLDQKTPVNEPECTEARVREWAKDRLVGLAEVCSGKATADASRRLVHSYVDRIDVDPHKRTGVLYLPENALAAWRRETSTRVALGESQTSGRGCILGRVPERAAARGAGG